MVGCWSALILAGVLWPWRATSQWVLYQAANSSSARRNSSMVSKWRSGRPAPGHRRDPRRTRPLGSLSRPPACQRGAGLQAGNLLPKQLGLHGHLADLPLQPRDLVVAVVAL